MRNEFTDRINFHGSLRDISKSICKEFNLGNFKSCKIVPVGYEDFNMHITASKGNFFIKIFSKHRTLDDCKRIIKIMKTCADNKINIPKLFRSSKGYLHILRLGNTSLRVCVMEYIYGKDFFSSKSTIRKNEIKSIAAQAALINSVKLRPKFTYDSWAITSFLKEFKDKGKYLNKDDLEKVKPLVREFKNLKINTLPHCFVHGDITLTNVMKDKRNKLWIVDFSCSNYYPRIQELAVLACHFLFDRNSRKNTETNIKIALKEYQKRVKLTRKELNSINIYIRLAHAMHVLRANYEKIVNKNNSLENEHFLSSGRNGLMQMS